jgi:hypothetical protein
MCQGRQQTLNYEVRTTYVNKLIVYISTIQNFIFIINMFINLLLFVLTGLKVTDPFLYNIFVHLIIIFELYQFKFTL